jgi:hypothetical protein
MALAGSEDKLPAEAMEWKKPRRGEGASWERAGEQEVLLPPVPWIRGSAPFCVTDTFGNVMKSVGLLEEARTHVQIQNALHTISEASSGTPPEPHVDPQ